MKVVLVGNAPYTSQEAYGNFIDDCDEVIRFNNFVLGRHIPYIGSKTTIRACVYNRFGVLKHSQYDHREIWSVSPRPAEPWYPTYLHIYGTRPVTWITAGQCAVVAKDIGVEHPSTGAVAIWWALGLWNHVYITGFKGLQKVDDRLHYYRDNTPEWVTHDGAAESEWIEFLVRVGEITRLNPREHARR